MKVLYPALITYDTQEHRYLIKFPDFSEAITEAASKEEALNNAIEVLTLTLEGRIDEGMEIPRPSKYKDAILIAPSARVQSSLLLKWTKGKYTKAKIARALETSWAAVSRLEDPHHWPSLKQIEKAANAVGRRLILSFE